MTLSLNYFILATATIMQTAENTAKDYTYRANSDDNILSEVTSVQCVLFPKTLLVAGYGKNGQLLMAHY
ncbi:MAG: hypothetical protein ABI378_12910, partial [Chitinophagaceae bacterium]